MVILKPDRHLLPSAQIRELVPESQAYMDLLAFERKLDQTIMRKRVDIQEALKRPMKVRTKKRAANTTNYSSLQGQTCHLKHLFASHEVLKCLETALSVYQRISFFTSFSLVSP